MAKNNFKCSRCSRSFVMKAHLARHENAIHGVKRQTGRAATGNAARPGVASLRTSRGLGFSNGAFDLMERMQGYHLDLVARRQCLDDEISAIARAMEVMGNPSGTPTTVKRGPGRPVGSGGGKGSLSSHIVRVLKSRSTPLSPMEIAQAVVKSGYATKSKDLTKAVSNALSKLDSVKRVGFGQYRV